MTLPTSPLPKTRWKLSMLTIFSVITCATLLFVNHYMMKRIENTGAFLIETELLTKRTDMIQPFHFLNETNFASEEGEIIAKSHQNGAGDYTIDILSIGSIHNIQQAKTQAKTWGSHISRRMFWLATEFDDPDPTCHMKLSTPDVEKICMRCRYRNADNWFTKHVKNRSMKWNWLQQKKNPAGWVCAQQRFPYAFSKLLKMYRTARENDMMDLPDYLILGDDDMYIHLEKFEESLLVGPEQNKSLQAFDLDAIIPPHTTPVVWAGCRCREPAHQIKWTFPFGGYGVYFSKASLERLTQPLYCNGSPTNEYEMEVCDFLKYNRTMLGEEIFFQNGMSVGDLMGAYTENIDTFCLHSDTMLAYIINFYNISRHVITEWEFGDGHAHSRLHAWLDSEIYSKWKGNCVYEGTHENCTSEAPVCHYVNEELMNRIQVDVKKDFPQKYN